MSGAREIRGQRGHAAISEQHGMIRRVLQLFNKIWKRFFQRGPRPVTLRRVVDEPTLIEDSIVYLVGERGNEWLAVMRCPCGCGRMIKLNLLECEGRPSWRVDCDQRKHVTITPSVWGKYGCKSHFVLRDGQIKWC